MAGIMDMFGGGDIYGDLLTDEQKQRMQQQTMMTMAAKLLQAGGPSTTPTSLGQALGGAFLSGQEAYGKAGGNAIQGMLTKQKIDEYRRTQKYREAMLGGTTAAPVTAGLVITPAQALAVGGTPPGPTKQRAGMIGGAAPASKVSEQDKMYADLQRKYDLSNQYGMTDESKIYFDQMQKIRPTATVTGQPFQATDVSGKPVMLQQFNDGTIKTVNGFGPGRNMSMQTLGGRMVAVDMNAVAPGSQMQIGMSPDAAANLGLNKQKFDYQQGLDTKNFNYQQGQDALSNARSEFDLVNTPAGSFYIPKPGVASASATPSYSSQNAAAPTAAPTQQTAAPTGQGNDFLRPAQSVAIPVLGPDGQAISTQRPPEAFSKAAKQLADMRQSLGAYKEEVRKGNFVIPGSIPVPFTEGGIPLPQGKDSAAMTAKYTAMTMGLKNLYELGALAGPDMSLLERQMTNPASFKGWLTSIGGMEEQIQVIETMLNRSEENLASSYRMPFKPSVYTPAMTKPLDQIFAPKGE